MTTGERNALVRQWLGLAWKVALKFWNPALARRADLVDLFQEAVIGLMVAARKYDPSHQSGAGFSTYAWHWVRRSVLLAVKKSTLVCVPSNMVGAKPDAADEEWNRRVERARAAFQTKSLPEDFDVTAANPSPDRDVLELDRLAEALEHLDAKRQTTLKKRFGLEDQKELSLKEISGELGVSSERIRQYEESALSSLRAWLSEGIEPDSTPPCRGLITNGAPCRRPANLDGYCAPHHPVHLLANLQSRMDRLFDEAEETGDWKHYAFLEGRERKLLAEVGRLRAPESRAKLSCPS